ncbi:hypothetical protein HQ576_15500, partial [bacterium]|nr:hypothetical protein [bacterium]
KVLFTAFQAKGGEQLVYTLHIANLAAARPATITGIPAWIKSLRAIRTSADESYKTLAPIPVADGTASLPLAPQSLTTLTTMSAR